MFPLNSLHIGRFTVKHIFKGLFLAAVALFLAMTIVTASAAKPADRSRHHRNRGHKGHAVTHHHTSHHATHRNQ
jgi:Spy/CpxP family protein refolding chaperone